MGESKRSAIGPTLVRAAILALTACGPLPVHAQLPGSAPVADPERRPTVGLALSGGSAKGFAHVGVIQELERAGVRVDVVAGTSMGSVVGALYAMGLSPDSIETLITTADWSIVLGDGAERERRFLHQRRFDERAVLTLPIQGRRVSLPTGATIGSNIMRIAERVTWPAATVRSFADLPRPFLAVATDIETGDAVTLTGGVLSETMRASSGIPGAFEPYRLNGRLLVDGALARNLPASDARDLGADLVICSDVSDPLVTREKLGTVVEVMDQVIALSMQPSLTEQRALCNVLVRPDVEELSGIAFDRSPEWIERGRVAAAAHHQEFLEIARQRGPAVPLERGRDYLGDSVRIARIEVEGTTRRESGEFVQDELRFLQGSYVSASTLSSRLSDIDATGLFGMVRYRLDRPPPAGDAAPGASGVVVTVNVEERPKDRVGVGVRYDDQRRAALLFTGTLHNLVRYGSVTRLDLRVGEETRARIAYLRRHGITGRFEGGTTVSWSQSELRLPGPVRPVSSVELATVTTSLGLVGERTTFFGLEATGELATGDFPGLPDAKLVSLAAVFDHESLDRIDFPRSGTDATMRWEWGATDLVRGGGFSVLTGTTRFYVPFGERVTVDIGGFVGLARGQDLPLHRTFFLGGQHPSAVFDRTHALFKGLESQELTGTVAQIGRLGVRWRARGSIYLRFGADVGGTADSWEFPLERALVGWAATLGVDTLIGPLTLELGKATGRSARLSVGVGRLF